MSRKFMNGIDLQAQTANNAADATLTTQLATWGQVQNLVTGLRKVLVATVRATGNLTLSGTQTIDGISAGVGDVVLADSQSTGSQDGLYVVAAGAWARSTDLPTGTNASGISVVVQKGTVGGDKLYLQTNDTAVVGTDDLSFSAIVSGVTYTADGNGIELSSTTFSLELDGTTLTKGSSGLRIGSGAAGAGLIESSGVLAVGAGSGVTVNANDVTVDSTVARVFQIATHASTTSIGITHSLGKQFVCAHVFVTSTGEEIFPDVTATSTSVTTFIFAVAPTTNTLTFVIHA